VLGRNLILDRKRIRNHRENIIRRCEMITPYLVFNGNCKDALDFYRSVFHCNEPKVLPYGDLYARRLKDPT